METFSGFITFHIDSCYLRESAKAIGLPVGRSDTGAYLDTIWFPKFSSHQQLLSIVRRNSGGVAVVQVKGWLVEDRLSKRVLAGNQILGLM